MVKLKVLTQLKFGKDDHEKGPRKVKSVQSIPKILTYLSNNHGRDVDEVLKKVASGIGI